MASEVAVTAARAYSDIVAAIESALEAAKRALRLAEDALDKVYFLIIYCAMLLM